MTDGVVAFHDAINPACGVADTLRTLSARNHPMVVFERDVGRALVQIAAEPVVEDIWSYLCAPSNRGQHLLPYVQPLLRRGDRVLDSYCGYSPLGFLLSDIELVGWDRDPHIIRRLRKTLPQHRWERIEERLLPFTASLPEAVDVLIGLGVSRPLASWDPRCVVDNVRYLLGRYLPRACLFETAAQYEGGAILDDLARVLARHHYECRFDTIETDMQSFPQRRILVAEQPV